MFRYKIDVVAELSKHGFTRSRIKANKFLSEQTIQNIKAGKSISLETLSNICIMLRCQPSDIVEVIATDEEKIKYF